MNRYYKATVTGNVAINATHNLLTFSAPSEAVRPLPGQFFMVEVKKGYDPLLKRAFSLFRETTEGLQILYRIRGRGTEALKDIREGSPIEVLGPLGNHYPVPPKNIIPLVIAGGIGIASVFPLIERLSRKAVVVYGARTKQELMMVDELQGLSRELYLCTDDGSAGERGTVLDVLNRVLVSHSSPGMQHLYSCGPALMLKEIAGIAADRGIKAYLSLEEHMACGIGACLGCVVRVKHGGAGTRTKQMKLAYKKVCKDGPVFDSEEVVW